MFNSGDIILAQIQFTDTFEIKKRPALILFEEYGNIVIAGMTSNLEMNGIKLTKKDGIERDSIIKLNYIFTISKNMVEKKLCSLNNEKKQEVYKEILNKLKVLNK